MKQPKWKLFKHPADIQTKGEYHLDLGRGWGVSLIPQGNGDFLCFIEKSERTGLRIIHCQTYTEGLPAAKRLSLARAKQEKAGIMNKPKSL